MNDHPKKIVGEFRGAAVGDRTWTAFGISCTGVVFAGVMMGLIYLANGIGLPVKTYEAVCALNDGSHLRGAAIVVGMDHPGEGKTARIRDVTTGQVVTFSQGIDGTGRCHYTLRPMPM